MDIGDYVLVRAPAPSRARNPAVVTAITETTVTVKYEDGGREDTVDRDTVRPDVGKVWG